MAFGLRPWPFRHLAFGLWPLVFGLWPLSFGLWLWPLALGFWHVAFGLFGLWPLALGFGLWALVSGPWALGSGLWALGLGFFFALCSIRYYNVSCNPSSNPFPIPTQPNVHPWTCPIRPPVRTLATTMLASSAVPYRTPQIQRNKVCLQSGKQEVLTINKCFLLHIMTSLVHKIRCMGGFGFHWCLTLHGFQNR
jgi:hypothetical protein